MTERTLSISPCPNDVWISSGIILGKIDTAGLRFQIDYRDIENLNGHAQRGERDVVKVSYANFVHCAEQYELLDCGGALGRGCGPLLLSRDGGFDETREVLVPGEFTTANFLLDYFLGRPVRKRFLPFDTLYEELCRVPGAQGVVIHEKRFTFVRDGLSLVRDLGEYWERKTGFAIPLGAVVVKKELRLKSRMENLIRASLAWAEAHEREAFALCRDYAQDLNEDVIRAHIDLYVNEYSRDLGTEGRAAVTHFLNLQRTFRQEA